MTLHEIDHVSFLVEHAQTFFAGEGGAVQTGLCAYRILKKNRHPFPFRSKIVFPLVCHVTNHFMTDPKQNWLSYIPQDVDQSLSVDYIFFSTGVIVGRKGCTSTHVQYSRLDFSGQNLESNGVCSKNETGSTVESTRVTGSLVIR